MKGNLAVDLLDSWFIGRSDPGTSFLSRSREIPGNVFKN